MTTARAPLSKRSTASSKKPASSPSSHAALTPADVDHAQTALVLQGGGALGSYQAGVYEALSTKYRSVDWVAGVSIGAINAALIVGNAPEHRVERLREFWNLVSSAPGQQWPAWPAAQSSFSQLSAASAVAMGIPGFFAPRMSPQLMLGNSAPLLSYYDTAALKATLERLVDFDRINHGDVRFSVGAVNVRTGNSVYFDNTECTIGPEHIMASGALPPGFPPVNIDGEDYWDGGIVSNTPLLHVLEHHNRHRRLLVLQVDLFNARGAMPKTLGEVASRHKDIQFSSRTRLSTNVIAANLNARQELLELLDQLPAALKGDAKVVHARELLRREPIDIVQLVYRQKGYETAEKDYEFSRSMMQEHWKSGFEDMGRTLAHPELMRSRLRAVGVTTYDMLDGDGLDVRQAASPV